MLALWAVLPFVIASVGASRRLIEHKSEVPSHEQRVNAQIRYACDRLGVTTESQRIVVQELHRVWNALYHPENDTDGLPSGSMDGHQLNPNNFYDSDGAKNALSLSPRRSLSAEAFLSGAYDAPISPRAERKNDSLERLDSKRIGTQQIPYVSRRAEREQAFQNSAAEDMEEGSHMAEPDSSLVDNSQRSFSVFGLPSRTYALVPSELNDGTSDDDEKQDDKKPAGYMPYDAFLPSIEMSTIKRDAKILSKSDEDTKSDDDYGGPRADREIVQGEGAFAGQTIFVHPLFTDSGMAIECYTRNKRSCVRLLQRAQKVREVDFGLFAQDVVAEAVVDAIIGGVHSRKRDMQLLIKRVASAFSLSVAEHSEIALAAQAAASEAAWNEYSCSIWAARLVLNRRVKEYYAGVKITLKRMVANHGNVKAIWTLLDETRMLRPHEVVYAVTGFAVWQSYGLDASSVISLSNERWVNGSLFGTPAVPLFTPKYFVERIIGSDLVGLKAFLEQYSAALILVVLDHALSAEKRNSEGLSSALRHLYPQLLSHWPMRWAATRTNNQNMVFTMYGVTKADSAKPVAVSLAWLRDALRGERLRASLPPRDDSGVAHALPAVNAQFIPCQGDDFVQRTQMAAELRLWERLRDIAIITEKEHKTAAVHGYETHINDGRLVNISSMWVLLKNVMRDGLSELVPFAEFEAKVVENSQYLPAESQDTAEEGNELSPGWRHKLHKALRHAEHTFHPYALVRKNIRKHQRACQIFEDAWQDAMQVSTDSDGLTVRTVAFLNALVFFEGSQAAIKDEQDYVLLAPWLAGQTPRVISRQHAATLTLIYTVVCDAMELHQSESDSAARTGIMKHVLHELRVQAEHRGTLNTVAQLWSMHRHHALELASMLHFGDTVSQHNRSLDVPYSYSLSLFPTLDGLSQHDRRSLSSMSLCITRHKLAFPILVAIGVAFGLRQNGHMVYMVGNPDPRYSIAIMAPGEQQLALTRPLVGQVVLMEVYEQLLRRGDTPVAEVMDMLGYPPHMREAAEYLVGVEGMTHERFAAAMHNAIIQPKVRKAAAAKAQPPSRRDSCIIC